MVMGTFILCCFRTVYVPTLKDISADSCTDIESVTSSFFGFKA